MAEGTWPNLLGKFKPHDDRHILCLLWIAGSTSLT
jgi:hypothetical protein